MDSACRAGSCGTCVTAIKDGEIEYLADPGSKPDSGTCLTCISVPKSDLVLDA
jgi:ferredoxin